MKETKHTEMKHQILDNFPSMTEEQWFDYASDLFKTLTVMRIEGCNTSSWNYQTGVESYNRVISHFNFKTL